MSDGNIWIQGEGGKLEILDEFTALAGKLRIFQALVAQAGNTPKLEACVLNRLAVMMLSDADENVKAQIRTEISDYLELEEAVDE